jgi:hypothetical protein
VLDGRDTIGRGSLYLAVARVESPVSALFLAFRVFLVFVRCFGVEGVRPARAILPGRVPHRDRNSATVVSAPRMPMVRGVEVALPEISHWRASRGIFLSIDADFR